ncbi:MAG: response regulator [Myxococcales bacterium]|nr:response regulator [Myxococcales bacterium]MCB9521363.1 response regulator [Myxococcales bacterium]
MSADGLGRKVLILDSNILDVIEAESRLAAAGFAVSKLASPNGALAKIEYERPDILLLDITMARLNVQEILDGLRADPVLEEIVVVLFSDLDAPTLQAMCMDNDIHGYFSKSMDIRRIGEFLEQFYAGEG